MLFTKNRRKRGEAGTGQRGGLALSRGALQAMLKSPGFIFKTTENQKGSEVIRCGS